MTVLRLFVTLTLSLCLFGCPQEDPPLGGTNTEAGPAYGDTIVMGSIGEPSNLIPALSSDSSSSDINGYVYDGLLRYDKNYELEPVLAESWDVS
ncbi:MAG: peptide-binding protein, partial [Desulfuromonadales bacterium]|nr:peptide-binding protein [Desulfuromonadales bacterium]NIR33577.1 peptide-binding protein [Desulfuromonadales bacterium]NIS42276.1 peptide-binding protein [Desulfuromonadales bacterium]